MIYVFAATFGRFESTVIMTLFVYLVSGNSIGSANLRPRNTSIGAVAFAKLTALTLILSIIAPELAHAQELAPLENVVDFLVNFLTGAFARSVAIIAVAVMGYLGLTGRLRWGVAGSIIVGIALIFGAATIVDAVSGAV